MAAADIGGESRSNTMKRWHPVLMRALSLWLCLSAVPLQAEQPPPEDPPGLLADVGAQLGEMSELNLHYLDTHDRYGMTPEKADALARSTARKLARHRDALADLLPQLRPDGALAIKLRKFLDRWPDAAAFQADLQVNDRRNGDHAGTELQSMLFLAPDRRSTWNTPFPFFRP
jgi:hypothetical protein